MARELPTHLGPPFRYAAMSRRITLAIAGDGRLHGPGGLPLGRFPGHEAAAAWCERIGWGYRIGMAGDGHG